MKTLKPAHVMHALDLTRNELEKWERSLHLQPQLTPGGHRYYVMDDEEMATARKRLEEIKAALQTLKHPDGKEGESPLAIKNGEVPIVVAGKKAEEFVNAKGLLRVTGSLRVSEKGVVVIDAENIEAVKQEDK